MSTSSSLLGAFILILLIAGLISVLRTERTRRRELQIICPNPNCGYRGKGVRTDGTSGCLFMLFLCIGVVPGLLYLILCGKPEIICPKCGMKIR